MTTPRPHLTVMQLAERLGCSRSYIFKHIDNPSNVPTPIRFGRFLRFRMADVTAWEDKHKLGTRTLNRFRIA